MSINQPPLRLDDFKKWMSGQRSPAPSQLEHKNDTSMVGHYVMPKLTGAKLASKMVVEEGDLHELVRDFKSKGGTVLSVDGQCLIVEVNSGTFAIQKFFVRTTS